MVNRFWKIIIVLIQPSQGIIDSENHLINFKVDFPRWADIESDFNFNDTPQIPRPALELEPIEPSLSQSSSQVDLPPPCPAVHSDLNLVFESNSHDAGTYQEGRDRKRAKTLVHLGQHLLTPSNSIPARHELTPNAHSQAFARTSATSADHNHHKDQIRDVPASVRPIIPSTNEQFTQDHTALPIFNHRFGSYETGTHRLNNLEQIPNITPDQPNGSSDVGLETPELEEDYDREIARRLAIGVLEKTTNKSRKRRREESDELIRATCQGFTASRQTRQDDTSINSYPFNFHWIHFEPSTIDGQIVTEVLANFKFIDGTNYFDYVAGLKRAEELDGTDDFNLVAGPNHAQQLDGAIQNQTPKKLFSVKPVPEKDSLAFFNFFGAVIRHSMHEFATTSTTQSLQLTRERFIFHSEKNHVESDHQKRILEYKVFVLENLKQSVTACRKTISESKIAAKKPKKFENVIVLLPLYLLYVDLISAILPVQPLDTEGKLLDKQRQIAGKYFIQLLQEALVDNNKRDLKNDETKGISVAINDFLHSVRTQNLRRDRTIAALMWKALKIWILTSRKDLNPLCTVTGSPFKEFFNKLLFSWIAKK